ncbi:phBC6A51 family helix-turn-helix protein [Chengkuizengella axinellae]|uniref:PhBC6A51 family helix-turn-helix protein n=1 Tax=Chengkuizengella axinellae TaxID=3064388 RepID=A0ABT9IVC9_9BACL|nr:phBC6A51 family helix-turn-helix protein [Chengkuizengella sp. 2205SS18-9]MDP5273223.1 phBC6A51 family helix-turn-helix protein [Chengkuizengella sp. 2205SS18-9]
MGRAATKKRKKALEAKLGAKKCQTALLLVEREISPYKERMTFDEIAKEVGFHRKTIWEWRTQDDDFIEYVNLLSDDFLKSKRPEVYSALMKLISGEQPSVKGIDLFFKRWGLLTEKQEITQITNNGGANQSNEEIAKSNDEIDELLKE